MTIALLCMVVQTAWAQFSGGSGTQADNTPGQSWIETFRAYFQTASTYDVDTFTPMYTFTDTKGSDPFVSRLKVFGGRMNIYGIIVDSPAQNYKDYCTQMSQNEKFFVSQLEKETLPMTQKGLTPLCHNETEHLL